MPPSELHRPICILSVGRSGTSLASRVLEELGVDFGPRESMLLPNDWNSQGFWEQRAIMELNDEILAALGGTYWDPPPLTSGWELSQEMSTFVDRVRALVDDTFDTSRAWGFKDPRTALTLPLWRRAVGEMDYVICVRRPAEVVASLHAGRPDLSREHLLGLWLRLTCEALRQTSGERRVILRYEAWFEDRRAAAEALYSLARGPEPLDEATWLRVAEHFEPSLRRQRAGDVSADDDLPTEAHVLDVLLGALAERADPLLEGLAAGLDAAYLRHCRAAADAAAAAEALAVRVEAAESRLTKYQRRVESAEAALRQSETLRSELQRMLAESHSARRAVEESATWRFSAPLRAARHGDARAAIRTLAGLLAGARRRRVR